MSFRLVMNGKEGAFLVTSTGGIKTVSIKKERVGGMEVLEVNTDPDPESIGHGLKRSPVGRRTKAPIALVDRVRKVVKGQVIGAATLAKSAKVGARTVHSIVENGESCIIGDLSVKRLYKALDDLEV